MGITELNYCFNCMEPLAVGQKVCSVCGHDNSRRENQENLLPEGSILSGKYFIGKVLGQGGFGVTYLGIDLSLEIIVAVKEYFPAGLGVRNMSSHHVFPAVSGTNSYGFEKGCEEFQSEAKILARFNSPNIVHVRDYFRENGTAYIVMDYISGDNLSKEIEKNGKMQWNRVLTLFNPLILELNKLHKKNLIHRDIKPDNLKIAKDEDGSEHLVLLDFGAARRFVSEKITNTYTALVSPGYAPLEQYTQRSHQGPFTDVYAICATMYAALTGTAPASALDRVTGEAEIQQLNLSESDVPESVNKALMHGLELKSADRTGTMHELYEEINEKEDSSDDFAVNAEKTDITGILPASDQMPASDAVIRINKSEPDKSKLDTVVLHEEEQKNESADRISSEKSDSGNKLSFGRIAAGLLLIAACVFLIFFYKRTRKPDILNETSIQSVSATVQIGSHEAIETVTTASGIWTNQSETKSTIDKKQTETVEAISQATSTAELQATQTAEESVQQTAIQAEADIRQTETAEVIRRSTSTAEVQATQTAEKALQQTATQAEAIIRQTETAEAIRRSTSTAEAQATQTAEKALQQTATQAEASIRQTETAEAIRRSTSTAEVQATQTAEKSLQQTATQAEASVRQTETAEAIRRSTSTAEAQATQTAEKALLQTATQAEASVRQTETVEAIIKQPTYAVQTQAARTATKSAVYAEQTATQSIIYSYQTGTVEAIIQHSANTELTKTAQSATIEARLLQTEQAKTDEIADAIINQTETPAPEALATVLPSPMQKGILSMKPEDISPGDTVTFGSYEQDNNLNNGTEPIEWRVLDIYENKVLLISRYGLEEKKYNEGFISVTWAESTLRKWLNVDFYTNAFNIDEQNHIVLSDNENSGSPTHNAEGGTRTADNIFILSYDEANQYFHTDKERCCFVTEYAKANGAFISDSNQTSWWWLRTPGANNYLAQTVSIYGWINDYGSYVNAAYNVVRPALWVSLPNDELSNKNNKSVSFSNEKITFGHYEQDNNQENGSEPIEWMVLYKSFDRVLLLSKYGLDGKMYNDSKTDVTWETCSLRKWLNESFYNDAFTNLEKEQIIQVVNRNDDNISFDVSGGSRTEDKIFLLSKDEVENYLEKNEDRQCGGTAYAGENRIYVDEENGNSWWWLRSPGESADRAVIILPDGEIFLSGDEIDNDNGMVRPALWIFI